MLTHYVSAAVFVSLFNFEAMLGTKGSGQSINTLIEVAVLPYLTMRWWHIATVLGALVAYRLFRSQGQLSVMIFFMIYIPLPVWRLWWRKSTGLVIWYFDPATRHNTAGFHLCCGSDIDRHDPKWAGRITAGRQVSDSLAFSGWRLDVNNFMGL